MTLHPPASLAAPNLAGALETTFRDHETRDAIITASGTLTYRDLAARTRAIAAGVRAVGTATSGQTPIVALVLERSPELVATVLGVLAAGAVYLPIDPDAPDAYLQQVFAEAQPSLIVAGSDRVERLRGTTTAPVLAYPDLIGATVTGAATADPVEPAAPAYVIYTSGSTGAPKGVLVPHSALLNSTVARFDEYGAAGRVLLLHSPAFDLTTGVLFWTILTGGVLIIDSSGLADVATTVELVHRHRVTHLIYPASLYSVFLDRAADRPPTTLRAVGVGSERWSPAVIDRHARLLPDTALINEYGPTEACVCSSYERVYDAANGQQAPMSIGRPVRNTGYLVLDDDGRPTGGSGELAIAGANLALGYLNRPELTAERFITTAAGERAYRTGDLVRQDPSGTFVFLERADRQVQVGGHRVEPGHVETVLMGHSGIVQAHVAARTISPGGSVSLVAYLVPGAESAREESLIAECDGYLRERVPAYLVPSAYVVIPELPRTRSGKIDQARLPDPALIGAGTAGAEPTDIRQKHLAAAAATILGVAEVPVDRSLLMLGANSLALIQLAAVIAADYGIDIPVSALFAGPTVTRIADLVSAAAPSARLRIRSGTSPSETGPDGVAGYPLSGQQEQIWVLTQLAPDSLAYSTQFSLRMHGPVDVDALQTALTGIVARHEILRTTFHTGSRGPIQVVHEPWQARVELVDLTGRPDPDRDAELAARIRARVADGFDVATLPLVRWHLFHLGPDEWRLLQVEHHFAHDGWSAQLFLAELRDAYTAIIAGREPDLPALPVQYRDVAAWYQQWRTTSEFTDQVDYWREHLAGCPAEGAAFATDRPRPAARSFRGGRLSAHVPAEVMRGLDDLAAGHQVSRFAVFLSAFALQVWQHSGERDIVLGSALVNRRQPGTERLLGMFVNALPLRVRVDPDAMLGALLRATMTVLLGAQDHQELPLLDLLANLDKPRDPGRNPLFNLMFAFHDTPRPRMRMGPVEASLVIEHNATAKGDVNVVCVPDPRHLRGDGPGGMTILWEYDADLFDADTAEELLRGFERVLTLLSRSADRRVRELDLLGADETARILALTTGPSDPLPFEVLHAGFSAAAGAHPEAVALEQGSSAWTYLQLDRRSRRVQRRLTDAGLRPGGVVAITCPAGIDLIATILATSRAGAKYVCLDPAQPAARTAGMLDDAGPSVIVATRTPAGAALPAPPEGVPVLYADDVPGDDAPAADLPADSEVSPADGAYLVYTSGSTGAPKAVLASHRNACAAVHARTRFLATEHTDDSAIKTLITLPVIFDVAPHMMLWTLWSGGTIVVPETAEQARDTDEIRTLIERRRVTHVNFTASFYRRLVRTFPVGWQSGLRVVAVGGEACSRDDVEEHAARVPGAALDHEYGPTEGTVWCSAQRLHPAEAGTASRVTVGRPLTNYSMVVLDPGGALTPVGAAGELYVGGAGVASGYHRRPDLTGERFVVPATGTLAGRRLYRTGDRARLVAGRFEILGRLDDQVKIRGFRVELGEITACLRTHPAVADAAVLLQDDGDTRRLIAYVATSDDDPGLPDRLREWAGQRLPSYMVPAAFVTVDRLPRTSTGKIQASGLPPAPATADAAVAACAPESPRQQVLLRVWRETLQQPGIGIDDDFFLRGGDSLQAIQAAARSRALGVNVSVAELLSAPTVRALDHLLATRVTGTEAAVAERRPGGTVLPLTAIQAWFFAQGFADPDHFHQARLLDAGHGDPGALRRALGWVIGRHDAFRTRFTRDADTWTAVLGEQPAAGLVSEHILPDGDEPLLERLDACLRGLHRRVSIAENRLAAFTVVRDPGSARTWVYLIAHHLIVDVVSWQILTDDLERAYRALREGRALPPGTAPGLPAEPGAKPAPHWHWTALSRAPKPVLTGPGTGGPPAGAGHRLRISRRLSLRSAAYLRNDVRRLHDISAQAVLLAALQRALAPYADGPDLYVWLEGHGRAQSGAADLENVVGWLTSLYPVLLGGHDVPPARLVDAAAGIDQQLAAVPDAGIGYGQARHLHPDSALGHQLGTVATPQVTFNYLGGQQPAAGERLLRPAAGPEAATIAAGNVLPTPIDVTIAADPDGTMSCHLVVDPALLDTAAAERVVEKFVAEVEAAARLVPLTAHPMLRRSRKLFLIHPVGGLIDWYQPLATALGDEWDCYGLPHDHTCNRRSMAEFGRAYLDRIRAAQPSGQYTLAGWCLGGPLAYEIARLALADGEAHRIADLILIDPPPAERPHEAEEDLVVHVQYAVPDQTKPAVVAALVATEHLPMAARAEALVTRLSPGLEPAGAAALIGQMGMRLSCHSAMATWSPSGEVPSLRVFMPETMTRGNDESVVTWRRRARSMTVTTIPGDHDSMLSAAELHRAIAGLSGATGEGARLV